MRYCRKIVRMIRRSHPSGNKAPADKEQTIGGQDGFLGNLFVLRTRMLRSDLPPFPSGTLGCVSLFGFLGCRLCYILAGLADLTAVAKCQKT